MAVPVQTPFVEYIANGVTTNFPLGFDCETQSHLILTVDDIEPITGSWSLLGGAVVFNSAPITGSKIIIKRNSPFERDRDFQLYDQSFRPPAVNLDLDRIWRKLQELGVMDWILGNRIDDLKNYVDDKDDELRAYLLEEIRKQGVALDQLEDYYNYLMQRLAEIAVNGGWESSFVSYGSINQKKYNDGVESIAELLEIQNPFDGMSVFVKSKDGGHFTYQSSKAAVNDGVIFYNGWTRITFETVYRSEWVGVTGVEGDDCVPKLKKLFEYVAAKGGGTCVIQDGVHSLNTVNVDSADGYTEHYAFGMYNNVTIEGASRDKTIFKLKSNLTAEAPQRWGLFVDNHRSDIVNFTAKNFKVDFNGYNNLCTPTLQPVYVVALVWDAYKANGLTFENIWCDKNSTWNSFFIGTRCEDSTIKNCLFTDHSDAIPNNAINDHSTIYINGKNARVENCVFTMPDNVVSYISTGIEGHGENTICIGNFVNGYAAPFLAASTEDNKHDDVSFVGNIAVRAQIGFAWNSMRGTLKASFIANPSIKLRKEKAPEGTIRYVHAAIESAGVVNSVVDRVNSYADIYIQGNYFEQVQPDVNWNASDVYINSCMAVKESRKFHASNNTFKGFKGGVLNVLAHRTELGTVIDLNTNTYIDCGNSSLQNAYQSAYRLEGLPFVTEEGQAYNLLDKIQVTSDVFLNCVYGTLLGRQDDLTARQIDITGIKYNGSFVPPVAIVKPVDLISGHTINIEYSTNGFVSDGQTLSDTQGVSGRIDLKHWSSTSVDDFLLQNISYVKTPYYQWNLRALSSNVPSNAAQFGAFPNKDGDRIEAVAAAPNGYSSFIRSNGVWYKTGLLDTLV